MDGNQLSKRYEAGDRQFVGADLSGADLSWLNLSEANFTGADLYAAQFRSAQLTRTNFSHANLSFARLDGADLAHSNLCGANLEGASLGDVQLTDALYDDETHFPIGFDAIVAGMKHRQVQEQEQAAAQQAQQNAIAPANPVATAHPTPAPATALPPNPANAAPLETQPAPEPNPSEPSSSESNPIASYLTETAALQQSTLSSSSRTRSNDIAPLIGGVGSLALLCFGGYFFWQLAQSPESNRSAPTGDRNPFTTAAFPQSACGDPAPTDPSDYPVTFYPVYADYSPENVAIIQARYCRDAYAMQRQETGQQTVQVASFIDRDRATAFAAFLAQNVGSGEVGSPRWVGSLAELSTP